MDLCHEVPNIVGVKDATGDISEVAELMSLAKGTVDVYSGNDDQVVPLLSLGGKGVISVLSNIAPRETHDIVTKFRNVGANIRKVYFPDGGRKLNIG